MKCFLLALTTLLFQFMLAQTGRQSKFTVIHLPQSTGYNKVRLNEEIAGKSTKEEVIKVVKLRNLSRADILFKIEDGKGFHWWTLNLDNKTDKVDPNEMKLQSKASTSLNFYYPSDFKIFFKDTLVLLDTLVISLYLQNRNYLNDEYFVRYHCGNDTGTNEQKIISRDQKIFFEKYLVSNCRSAYSSASIYNYRSPQKHLAHFYLKWLTSEQKAILSDMSRYYKVSYPNLSQTDIASFVESYATKNFGPVYFPQLMSLVEESGTR